MISKSKIIATLAVLLSVFFAPSTFSQTHYPGVYVLGPVDKAIPTTSYTQPFVTGGAIRITWGTLEPSENVYDWSFLDNEIATAQNAGKKVSIAVFASAIGTPAWLWDYPVIPFNFIDMNPNHASYLDTLKLPLPYDTIYLAKLSDFLYALGNHYASDPNIAYMRDASGMITEGWGLADTDAYGNSWAAYNYSPDTLMYAYRKILDTYMAAFPFTSQWVEVGNISFEHELSGNSQIYVGEQMALYGFTNYPDRFNVWREDFSTCFPDPPPSNSFWHILWDNPCHCGAQALSSVQDGGGTDCSFDMSPCDNITVCSKDTVLWKAIERALDYKMPYLEIYPQDIEDVSLQSVLQQAADSLSVVCSQLTILSALSNTRGMSLEIYPNPSGGKTIIEFSLAGTSQASIDIYNLLGEKVLAVEDGIFLSGKHTAVVDAKNLPAGTYFIKLLTPGYSLTKKIVITK